MPTSTVRRPKKNNLRFLLPIIPKLGIGNVLYVIFYRLALKLGIKRMLFPPGASYEGEFFREDASVKAPLIKRQWLEPLMNEIEEIHNGRLRLFSRHVVEVSSPPDWFLNHSNSKRIPNPNKHWTMFNEFNMEVGDIKTIWELSRFDWALKLAHSYVLDKDKRDLELINSWVSHWVRNNPLNVGPNWKCGQEASIRMMNMMMAAFALGQASNPSSALIKFVTEHCERISKNIRYAISQNNNHGTSEAAALFIGGSWLKSVGGNKDGEHPRFARLARRGRCLLEKAIKRLVAEDGSFAQYSVTYHRVFLDTLCMAVFWQRQLGEAEFSKEFYERARKAVNWLFQMIDPKTGDAPNMGANDGALFFPLSNCDYRDFRPSVQLGAALFFGGRVYEKGPWDEPLCWLGLQKQNNRPLEFVKRSSVFNDGGYVTFKGNGSWGLVRIPAYKFRPNHADALHFDLWNDGINILRDSGTYSYNCESDLYSYFTGVESHNTVQFDGHDQMPRISRFLFGAWTKGETRLPLNDENGSLSWSGSYADYRNCRHERKISVKDNTWEINDSLSRYKNKAVLRWRLSPGEWNVTDNKCIGKNAKIEIFSIAGEIDIALIEGWESRYYMEKSEIPVLECEVHGTTAEIKTVITLT